MKPSEIREMTFEDLQQKMEELTKELFAIRFQHAIGQVENPMKLPRLRRDIARIKTIIKEKGMKKEGIRHGG